MAVSPAPARGAAEYREITTFSLRDRHTTGEPWTPMNFGVARADGLTVITASVRDLTRTIVRELDGLANCVTAADLVIDLSVVSYISEDAAAEITAVIVRVNADRDVIVVSDEPEVRLELDASGLDIVVPLVHRLDQAFTLLGRPRGANLGSR